MGPNARFEGARLQRTLLVGDGNDSIWAAFGGNDTMRRRRSATTRSIAFSAADPLIYPRASGGRNDLINDGDPGRVPTALTRSRAGTEDDTATEIRGGKRSRYLRQ